VDGYGGLGPMARQLLYGEQPRRRLTFPPDQPHANTMYARVASHPTPQGIVPLASIRWKQHRTRPFFGHSYTAPTPHEFILQKMGLRFTKAFALHIRNSCRKLGRHNAHTHPFTFTPAHAPATTDPT